MTSPTSPGNASRSTSINSACTADQQQSVVEGSSSWTDVVTTRGRSKSLSEHATDTTSKLLSKSARKNARRKERKKFEKKWGVRPDGSGIGGANAGRARSQSLVEDGSSTGRVRTDGIYNDEGDDEHADDQPCPRHDDEALNRALAASMLEHSSLTSSSAAAAAAVAVAQEDDPRRKRLRNLKKKISAAQALLEVPAANLDDGQRAKLERLSSLQTEADTIQKELDAEEEQRRQQYAEHRAAVAASHRRRIAEWSALSDGTAVRGFRAGADQDEFACPLCHGPLEAATSCTPCRHVFCRACLEDALGAAAERSGGDPKSLNCPMCRGSLFDAIGDRMLVEPALNVRKRMRKRKCECKCGEEVALSSLRAHLRYCNEAAPELFADDARKRFGHEFERPRLDPDKVADMAGRKRRGGNGPIRSSQQAVVRGLVPEGYDEEAALQAALALSSLET